MIVSRCLIPVTNQVPVDLEHRVVVASALKRVLDARDSQKFVEAMCIEVIYDRLVRYFVLSKLPNRAGFQSTFYGVAEEVISSPKSVALIKTRASARRASASICRSSRFIVLDSSASR